MFSKVPSFSPTSGEFSQASGDGGLPIGLFQNEAMHEFRAPESTSGHIVFAIMLAIKLPADRPILWVSTQPTIYPPGLAWLGLEPARCLFAHAKNDAESLGMLEAALRGGMSGIVECCELSRLAARRLALAARQGHSSGFLLRHASTSTPIDSTAFTTRWMISPVPNKDVRRLRAELLYAKGGQPGVFFFDIDREAKDGTAPFTLTLVSPGVAKRATEYRDLRAG